MLERKAGLLMADIETAQGLRFKTCKGAGGEQIQWVGFCGPSRNGIGGRRLGEHCKKFIASQKARGQKGFREASGQAGVCGGVAGDVLTCCCPHSG